MDAEGAALAGRRLPPPASRPVLTNFYPRYDGDNDQVDPVLPVRRVFFQRIIPRYRLSTSETRDEGLGPDFVYAPVRRFISRRGSSGSRAATNTQPSNGGPDVATGGSPGGASSSLYRIDRSPPEPIEPWLGRLTNLYV